MYTTNEKQHLLNQVKYSIEYGLKHYARCAIIEPQSLDALNEIRACFVTLHLNNSLRGCIGSLTATKPLIEDVNANAYSAAFEDPRFQKLTLDEFLNIDIEISVLSIPEKIFFSSESNLLSQLRIGIDGVIFEYKHYRATYLPSVWQYFKTGPEFLNSLKEKSGLDLDFWSEDVRCFRYTTETIK